MSNIGARQLFELLDAVRRTAQDLAVREEKLNQGLAAEQVKHRQRLKDALADDDDWFAAELRDAESALAAGRERLTSQHEQRKARAMKAGNALLQREVEEIESHEGKRKFEIQRGLVQTSRVQETAPGTIDRERQEFIDALSAEDQELARLEGKAVGAFSGYPRFTRMLTTLPEGEGVDLARDEHQLLHDLRELIVQTRHQVGRVSFSPLLLLFRFFPVWLLALLLVLGHALVSPVYHPFSYGPFSYPQLGVSLALALAALSALYFLGRAMSASAASAITSALARARRLVHICEEKSAARHQSEMDRLRRETGGQAQSLSEQWNQVSREAARLRTELGRKIDARVMRIIERSDRLCRERLGRLEQQHEGRVKALKQQLEVRKAATQKTGEQAGKRIEADNNTRRQEMISEWTERVQAFQSAVTAAGEFAKKWFPDWNPQLCQSWTAPESFAHGAKFGTMDVDFPKLAGTMPLDPRLAFPGPARFQVPMLLALPQNGSLLLETKNAGHDQVVAALNNLILRLLAVAPPGRVKFTIIDPVELGQNFAGVMHLADFEDTLISNRIWTQPAQIEQQLGDLNEHIEKVTQMYLRNEYASITEYNEQAGRIAEKYRFLVVADFPVNFSELAIKRLLSIAASGPRCGVYTLLHWDQRRPSPAELVPDELRKNSIWLQAKADGFFMSDKPLPGLSFHLETPPAPDLATDFLQRVGKASIDSNRVEMPFAEVAPAPAEVWTNETTNELRVAVGRTGATKLQYMALGKGTRQHALVAGKTGSGKSTLFHVLITNLSLWCSPEQVEFYLVDFKKGVEFKCYATGRLPHARVVAIESDREFGLSVLQRVDEELKRRGDLFRNLGVQDLAGYKKAGGAEPIPRTLLIIDEFQEFFVEDDRVAQGANLLLDRLVRQGRAFGIHVILGSQTLGGAYTLARPTLGQMVVRIALQCNEADAYLIMDENNAAPRLLSRPGEAIYNDAAGAMEGNSPFQIVWLPDDIRETYLNQVRGKADASKFPGPIVFEGNAPAHIEENAVLRGLLEAPAIQPVPAPRAWLGAPNSIKGPTEVVFHRQSGNNLLIVGQRDEAALAMLVSSLLSLAAQHPRGTAKFVVLDCTPPETPQRQLLENAVRALPHEVLLARNADIEDIMSGLAADLEQRGGGTEATSSVYLFIYGLQRFRKLRFDEDLEFSLDPAKAANPAVQLSKIITEGPAHGIHVICSCDNVNNLNRCLNRKTVGEFDLRVLFQMSANDSALLIDSPKAGNLGLHRALLFNEQEGYLETFRPYALPGEVVMAEIQKQLARLVG